MNLKRKIQTEYQEMFPDSKETQGCDSTPLGKLREDRGLSHVIAELDRAPGNKTQRNNPNCSPGMSEMTS